MGVKNNFSQAVSELIGISRNVEPEHKAEISEEPTGEVLEAEAIAEDGSEEEGVLDEMAGSERDTELTAEQKEETSQTAQNPKERIMAMLAAQQAQQTQQQAPQTEGPQQSQPQAQQAPLQQTPLQVPQTTNHTQPKPSGGGLTTIAKGTVIIGEINADGDVELLGSVKGKIASQGDIKANGKVIGDLIGKDIELVACAVQGNIIASGLITVDGDSVVVGDVKGENFCLDGKIKGNVTVEKEAKFQPKAILAGNVTTTSIAMSQGAKIQGEVNIPLSEKETDMSFDIDMMI
ncbi:MAG: polymer-forming cytoskeletal protein [Eubacteriales bacterium]|nr:polymer-forming cytoskeletal protein [Eubacteriales bacterium]